MKVKTVKILLITSILLCVAVATVVVALNLLKNQRKLTREEAIERSKGSSLVQDGLEIAHSYSIEVNYLDLEAIEQRKEGHLHEIFIKVPENHTAWEIIWYISKGVGGYNIIVIVDADTGAIIHEEKGVELL